MGEMTALADLRYMLLFLCMEQLASKFEIGLAAEFEGEELKDVNRLFWHLRGFVKDQIGAAATGHRLAMEDAEEKEKEA